jgi:hypothetical protein
MTQAKEAPAFSVATAWARTALAVWKEVGLLGPLWWDGWQQFRRLERAGVLQPDGTSADYLVLMIRGLLFSGSIVGAVNEDPARSPWLLARY